MAISGINGGISDPKKDDNKRKRNRILLASAIALALLLFLTLGNPGLWTPQDDGEAEATDDSEDTDGNDNLPEPESNSTGFNNIVTISNETTGYTWGDNNLDAGDDESSSQGSWGYVINYVNESDSRVRQGSSGGGGGGGGSASGSGGDSNRAPTAQDQQLLTSEDVPLAFQMHGTDPDGDELEFALVSNPANGSLDGFSSITGEALYGPNTNFNGTDSFIFLVNDGRGKTATGTISIAVNSINDAPLVSNSTHVVTEEDTPVTIDLLSSASDPDGAGTIITITNVTQPSHGTVILNPNNTVTYYPEPNYNGEDGFGFQATDGVLTSNMSTVMITVNPVNDGPMAINATVSTLEDTPVDITVVNSTSDVDGDVSSLVITQLPSFGLVTIDAGNNTITYTPDNNFEGSDSFEYIISDGTFNSTGTISINVIPVNDAPFIVDGALGSIAVDEDGSVIVDIISNVVDPEGDSVTITNVTQPSHGTVILNPNNTVTYIPDPDYNGQDSFEFTVSDGNGGETTGTVIITVGSVNDVPISNNSSVGTDEDNSVEFQLDATDADGESMLFTLVSSPVHGSISMLDANSGLVRYVPDLNYNGPDSFTFQATDGIADSNIANVDVTVNPVNDDPIANDDNFAGDEDTPITLDVLADDSDIDGDTLAVDGVSEEPAHGTAVVNSDNSVTYVPELNFNGTDSFEYKISDGNGGSSTATVTITIGATNDAPDSDNGAAIVNEDAVVEILLNGTDADGDMIAYAITSMPAHGSIEVISADGSLVRYTPSPDFHGSDYLSFQATDGIADSNIATVDVTVNPVNDDPLANNDNVMAQEDIAFNGNVLSNDNDIDGDILEASLVNGSLPGHGVIVMNVDGTFTYTPEANFNGVDSFQYSASDGNGGTAVGNVMVTITPVNDSPMASDDSGYTTLSQPVLVKVLENDSDMDSTNLNVGSVGSASHGTVTISADGKGVIYTPANGYLGMDQFSYSVTDGSSSATATVTIKVYNIKFGHLQPPVGGGGDHEFEQGNTANVRLDLKDADGNDIVDAVIILRIQEVDSNNVPIGLAFNATSSGGSNDDNLFRYTNSWYQYNLKTEDMTPGKWALYVYMIDSTSEPAIEVLLEDAPIDGISTTILVK